MKAVLQRASKANVAVENKIVGQINKGLVILLCIETGDTEEDCQFIARKCSELRIFADEQGKMNLSLSDIQGEVLLISQFTLAAEWKKGRRPGFTKAANPLEGERLYKYFASLLKDMNIHVELGIFGADMAVSLTNDGPVTLMLDYQNNKACMR